jgi:hypothetical protein
MWSGDLAFSIFYTRETQTGVGKEQRMKTRHNQSPEPTPLASRRRGIPRSRLTVWAAWFSFLR